MTPKSVYKLPEFALSSDFKPKPSFWGFVNECSCIHPLSWDDSYFDEPIAKFVNSILGSSV